jgi:hypothetical protein
VAARTRGCLAVQATRPAFPGSDLQPRQPALCRARLPPRRVRLSAAPDPDVDLSLAPLRGAGRRGFGARDGGLPPLGARLGADNLAPGPSRPRLSGPGCAREVLPEEFEDLVTRAPPLY